MFSQKRLTIFLLLVLTFVFSFCGAESILRQHINKKREGEPEPKTVLFADEIINDDKNKIVTAKGHVEITRDNKTIFADMITYNEQTDVIT